MTKYYYTISEVCKITKLEQHVLRYWETEFPQLNPKRRKNSNRRYSPKDIKIIKKIKYLLYSKEYTIKGAIKRLHDEKDKPIQSSLFDEKATERNNQMLKKMKCELINIKQTISKIQKK